MVAHRCNRMCVYPIKERYSLFSNRGTLLVPFLHPSLVPPFLRILLSSLLFFLFFFSISIFFSLTLVRPRLCSGTYPSRIKAVSMYIVFIGPKEKNKERTAERERERGMNKEGKRKREISSSQGGPTTRREAFFEKIPRTPRGTLPACVQCTEYGEHEFFFFSSFYIDAE